MEQAKGTARAKAQSWDPANQSQERARGPLGVVQGEGAEAGRNTEPIFRLQSGREQSESWPNPCPGKPRPGGGGPTSAHSLLCDFGNN